MKRQIKFTLKAAALVAVLFIAFACEDEDVNNNNVYENFTITVATHWGLENKQITVKGRLLVNDATLTIEPGTIIRMDAGARIEVRGQNGAIIANGTPEKGIAFTSAASNPKAGDWEAIDFRGSSPSSSFSYCLFEYGGRNSNYGIIYIDDASVSITHSDIRESGGYGIYTGFTGEPKFGAFSNNMISNCAKAPILIHPQFVHTIGEDNLIETTLGIEVKNGNYTNNDATWHKQTVPYVLAGSLTISGNNNPTLRIQPGTRIEMKSGGIINIGGTGSYGRLIAKGTEDEMITFSSNAAQPQSGDWHYIMFREGSTDCELEYCHIEFGGGNTSYPMIEVAKNALVSINNSVLGHSQNYTIRAMDGNGFQSFNNNTIHNDFTHPLWVSVANVTSIGEGNEFITTENSGIYVREGTSTNRVTTDAVWHAQTVPYFFERSVEVRGNATLTLQPGIELRFANDRALEVGVNNEDGKLIAVGTPEHPITFRSAAHSPQPGNWRGLRFLANTLPGTIMEHCVVMHGGSYNLYQGNVTVEPCGAGNPIIKNSEFSESSGYGIYRRKLSNQWGDPLLENNVFFNNASGDVNEID